LENQPKTAMFIKSERLLPSVISGKNAVLFSFIYLFIRSFINQSKDVSFIHIVTSTEENFAVK